MTPAMLGRALARRRRTIIAAARSRLLELTVVELAMKPIAVARDILLHRDVKQRLEHWDTRNILERHGFEADAFLLVFRGVGFEFSRLDQLVHFRVLV